MPEVSKKSPAPSAAEGGELAALDYLAIVLAWVIPGAGHFFSGEKARGLIFASTIHGLFFIGLFIGGLKALNPSDQPIWSVTQYLTGWPMVVATQIQKNNPPTPEYSPRVQDVGSVYCGIAGMLNMLVIFDAMLRLTGARGSETPPETPAPADPKAAGGQA